SRAPEVLAPCGVQGRSLEVELERKLYAPVPVLFDDVPEVSQGVLRELVTLGRVADVVRGAHAVRHAAQHETRARGGVDDVLRLQRQVDVAEVGVGERLVEGVEESDAELELLRLREVEVLEEGHVEVAPVRAADVEGRLVRPRLPEARNLDGAQVEVLVADAGVARLRVAQQD